MPAELHFSTFRIANRKNDCKEKLGWQRYESKSEPEHRSESADRSLRGPKPTSLAVFHGTAEAVPLQNRDLIGLTEAKR
jgi:hypothetical protein